MSTIPSDMTKNQRLDERKLPRKGAASSIQKINTGAAGPYDELWDETPLEVKAVPTSTHVTDIESGTQSIKMSLASATFSIVKVVCGMGMLNMPRAFAEAGVLTGILVNILVGALCMWSYDTIGYCCTVTDEYTFSGAWNQALLGTTLGYYGSWLPDATVILTIVGGIGYYLMIMGHLLSPIFTYIRYRSDAHNVEDWVKFFAPQNQNWIYTVSAAVPMAILAMCKNYESVKYPTMFGFGCTVTTVIFIVVNAIINRSEWTMVRTDGTSALFTGDIKAIITLISTVIFGLQAHMCACQVYAEWNEGRVTDDNREEVAQDTGATRMCRRSEPVVISFIITVLVFIVVGTFGYLRFSPANVKDLPGQILKLSKSSDGKHFVGYQPQDIGALVIRVLMAFSVFFTSPMPLIYMRVGVGKLLFPNMSKGNSLKWRILSTSVLVAICTGMACGFQYGPGGFGFLIELMANFFGGLIMFIYPAIMYIRLAPPTARKLPYYLMLAFGITLVGFFTPWSIIQFVRG